MTEQAFEHDDEISLLDILVTLAESWKLLVFCPLVVGVLAGALSFLWPNTYESVAIVRISEEESALLHSAPVLDSLITKFDLLKESNGFQEGARLRLKARLTIVVDKKTKLATLVAKARTPQDAQALGAAAIEVLLKEFVVKGKDKEAVLKTIAINQQAMDVAQDAIESLQRSLKRGGALADLQQESAIKNLTSLNVEVASRAQSIADLTRRLEPRGEEIYVQKAGVPEHKISPTRSFVVVLAVLASGFALLVWILVSKAWRSALQDSEFAGKVNAIKKSLGCNRGA